MTSLLTVSQVRRGAERLSGTSAIHTEVDVAQVAQVAEFALVCVNDVHESGRGRVQAFAGEGGLEPGQGGVRSCDSADDVPGSLLVEVAGHARHVCPKALAYEMNGLASWRQEVVFLQEHKELLQAFSNDVHVGHCLHVDGQHEQVADQRDFHVSLRGGQIAPVNDD